jgi:hypothetical protein
MIYKKRNNKLTTPGYFIKRLRDNKIGVVRIFQNYSKSDARSWTILVDPGAASIFITCYENKTINGEILFELNDGGILFPKNFSLKTDSIEVVVTLLLERGVKQLLPTDKYYVEKS